MEGLHGNLDKHKPIYVTNYFLIIPNYANKNRKSMLESPNPHQYLK